MNSIVRYVLFACCVGWACTSETISDAGGPDEVTQKDVVEYVAPPDLVVETASDHIADLVKMDQMDPGSPGQQDLSSDPGDVEELLEEHIHDLAPTGDAADTSSEISPCMDGTFIIEKLSLGAKGFDVEAAAGQVLSLVANWSISNPPTCEGCTRYVVVGVEDDAGGCMPAGKPATCPMTSEGVGLTSVVAPSKPGTYNVYASAPVFADTCAIAKSQWLDAPNRQVVGVIHVAPGCLEPGCPGTECEPLTCAAIGKSCGTWGDGCRHDLACGNCPVGTECSLHGLCTGPCAQGWLQGTSVHVAGSGKSASAKPGEEVGVTLDIEVGNLASCQGCDRQLLLGFDSPALCQEIKGVPTCPEFVQKSISGLVTVPTAPGQHTLYLVAPAESGCDSAKQAFNDVNVPRVAVATVMVHASCDPQSCQEAGRECGPLGDGCGFQLDCGDCAPGDTCSSAGKCACSAADAFEPNNKPGQAYKLGKAGDSDLSSHKTLVASMENEADWFVLQTSDDTGTVMDPFVRVETPVGKPFHLEVAYICADGTKPALSVQEDSTCAAGGKVDLSSAGLSSVTGFVCDSDGTPVIVHFEPSCPGTIDDSGRLFIGVSSSGYCTSYTVDLHL